MNHTSDDPNFKVCHSGDKCKHRAGPILPLSEFYARGDGSLFNKCRECTRDYQRQRPNKNKGDSLTWRTSEQGVVNYLRSHNVYAVAGIASEWVWVDVVAWGCVRIEVKTSRQLQGNRYQFGLASKNRKNWHKNDLVMLVCQTPDGNTCHLFERDDPVFYARNGKMKQTIIYIPEPKHKRKRANVLTQDIMSHARDRFELIDRRVKQWIADNDA